jgi:hypothetical protein
MVSSLAQFKVIELGSPLQEELWRSQFLLRRTKDMLDIPPMVQRDEW